MDAIERIDVKVFASQGQDIDPYEFVPVLQKWIREHSVPGVLIDVADYSHMHNGPGVILVGHQYNLSVEYTDGKLALLYHAKRPDADTFVSRAQSAVAQVLDAAELLSTDEAFAGRLAFDTSNIRVIVSDRLHAPNTGAGAELADEIRSVIAAATGSNVTLVRHNPDPRSRLTFDATAA